MSREVLTEANINVRLLKAAFSAVIQCVTHFPDNVNVTLLILPRTRRLIPQMSTTSLEDRSMQRDSSRRTDCVATRSKSAAKGPSSSGVRGLSFSPAKEVEQRHRTQTVVVQL